MTRQRKKTLKSSELTSANAPARVRTSALEGGVDDAVGSEGGGKGNPAAEHQPPDRLGRLACCDQRTDGRVRQPEHEERDHLEQVARGDEVEDERDREEHGREREESPRERRSSHRATSRSHTEVWAGCIVSVTTPRRSCSSVPRSICSRSRAPKPSSVRCAS